MRPARCRARRDTPTTEPPRRRPPMPARPARHSSFPKRAADRGGSLRSREERPLRHGRPTASRSLTRKTSSGASWSSLYVLPRTIFHFPPSGALCGNAPWSVVLCPENYSVSLSFWGWTVLLATARSASTKSNTMKVYVVHRAPVGARHLRHVGGLRGGGRPSASTAGRAAADSFGDDNPVTLGIRDHALVISVARPPWPIEKRVPVALQSFCKGVDGGPRAQLHTQVCVPNELARAL